MLCDHYYIFSKCDFCTHYNSLFVFTAMDFMGTGNKCVLIVENVINTGLAFSITKVNVIIIIIIRTLLKRLQNLKQKKSKRLTIYIQQ